MVHPSCTVKERRRVGKRTPDSCNRMNINENIKCSYCGSKAKFYSDSSFTEAYCSEQCEKLHRVALNRIKKNMKWFCLGIAISILLLIVGAVSNLPIEKKYIAGSGMALLGITVIVFPFCTPEAYQKYGYVKTTKIGRLLGIFTEAVGIVILFMG